MASPGERSWWRPRQRDWWMAVLFVIGSACFTVGAVVAQWSSVSRPGIGFVFFGGSIFFTAAASLQFAESLETRRRIDRISALVQLIGTILFNISTFAALRHNLTTHQQNARVWAPDAFGSIAFLVSSGLAFYGVRDRWWCFELRSRDWDVAALNLLGSIAFGISAVASLVEPSTGEPVSAHIANSGTSFGGLCFLIAALVLIPPRHRMGHADRMMCRGPDMMNFQTVSPIQLQLGKPVRCTDGVELELADVVIDPTTRRVTHLVVQPHDRHDLARMVPISLAMSAADPDATLGLSCSSAELESLDRVQHAAYLRLGQFPVEDPDYEVGIEETYALPYYGTFAPGGIDAGLGPVSYDQNAPVIWDRIPKGEVEIRRGSAVTASDGRRLGHVEGFLVDEEQLISHFVLEHGHLWGKREIVVPIGAVDRITSDDVRLSMTKDEVEKLESPPVHRW